jgi:hypothetical protein
MDDVIRQNRAKLNAHLAEQRRLRASAPDYDPEARLRALQQQQQRPPTQHELVMAAITQKPTPQCPQAAPHVWSMESRRRRIAAVQAHRHRPTSTAAKPSE